MRRRRHQIVARRSPFPVHLAVVLTLHRPRPRPVVALPALLVRRRPRPIIALVLTLRRPRPRPAVALPGCLPAWPADIALTPRHYIALLPRPAAASQPCYRVERIPTERCSCPAAALASPCPAAAAARARALLLRPDRAALLSAAAPRRPACALLLRPVALPCRLPCCASSRCLAVCPAAPRRAALCS